MEGAFAYSGKTVTVNNEDYDVPEFSVFQEKCHCGNCHIAYIPAINKYFINEWECNIGFPMVVIILTLLAAIFGTWSLYYTTSGAVRIVCMVIYLLTYFIWWIAYLNAMCRSPGYLPWFWFVEKRRKYTWEEHMAGIITTPEQTQFASALAKPERAILSGKARRIVLRADHICKWIGNWVGLKNYRYFFTQLIWFILIFICFFIIFILEIVDMAKHGWRTLVPRIALFILIIPVILFFIFFMIVFIRHIRYLITNNTTVHELKAQRSGDFSNPYDLGCKQNCIQTIGDEKYCCIWFCPCPIPRTSDGFYWKRNDNAFLENRDEFDQHDNANAIDYENPPNNIVTPKPAPLPPVKPVSPDDNILLGPKDSEETEYLTYEEEDEESSSDFLMMSTVESTTYSKQPPKPVIPVPQPPPLSGEFAISLDQNVEPITPTQTEPKSSFMDTLQDKTVDGDNDENFDAITKGKKPPPLPVDFPQELSIRETDPNSPHPADKRSRRYYENLRKPHFKHEPDYPKRLKHVHVKKVRVAVLDEKGNPTGRHKIKKIKTFSDIEKTQESKKSTKTPRSTITSEPGYSAPPTVPGSHTTTKEKNDFMFGFSMSSRDFGDDTFGDEYYLQKK